MFVHEWLEWSLVDQSPKQSNYEWLCIDVTGEIINTFHSSRLRLNSSTLHMFLHGNISANDCAREMFFKRFGKSLRLQWKKFFRFGFLIFPEWYCKWSCFRPSWPTSSGPRPKPLDSSVSPKFLLETRLKSESFDTWMICWGFWFKSYDLK